MRRARPEPNDGAEEAVSYDEPMLRLLTAGESHGKALVGVLEGLPAGIPVSPKEIAAELARRRHGHGRSGRQKLEGYDTFSLITY